MPAELFNGAPDPRRLRHLIETVARFAAALDRAAALQWTAAPVVTPRDDVGGSPVGGPPSNPTLDTVLDGRRLGLRSAVLDGYRLVEPLVRVLEAMTEHLDRAVERWYGDAL